MEKISLVECLLAFIPHRQRNAKRSARVHKERTALLMTDDFIDLPLESLTPSYMI